MKLELCPNPILWPKLAFDFCEIGYITYALLGGLRHALPPLEIWRMDLKRLVVAAAAAMMMIRRRKGED